MEQELTENLYFKATGAKAEVASMFPSAGSSRRYIRVTGSAGPLIVTVGEDPAENEAFIYLSKHFVALGLPVPEVLGVSDDRRSYIQTDLGDTSLYSLIAAKDEALDRILEESMKMLADFHRRGAEGLDFSRCFPVAAMDEQAVMWDLNYFKYCFLKPLIETFSEVRLERDFRAFAALLTEGLQTDGVFMIRDFQSRNVMVRDGHPYLIDFQGGRLGMPHYDVASFLWQARAGFSPEQREHLIDVYLRVSGYEPVAFRSKLNLFVLFRVMQTLGAYGFRGYVQHKAQFVTTIPAAVENLRQLLETIPAELGYLRSVLSQLCDLPALQRYSQPQGLTVRVSSFSFKKGVPVDPTGNGGGFVFDCRAIHNPGRYEQYKKLTGRDEPVKKFLEDDGEVFGYLDHVYALVDESVDRYLRRGFDSLQVDFGCTGGRHRSVYCAEALTSHLAARGDVNVVLNHREQGITVKFLLP